MDGSGTPQTAKTSRTASVQKRVRQVVLIGSCVYLSWLGMMIVHEFGHVLIAWHTGGTVNHVLLHPFNLNTAVERGCRVQLPGLNAFVQKRGLTRWVS